MKKPTKDDIVVIRNIAQKFDIKYCRMSNACVQVGRQNVRVEKDAALKFISAVKAFGFYVPSVFVESAELDIADTFQVYKIV